jgi:MIP family channel proteins
VAEHRELKDAPPWRLAAAEIVGTFALTFAAAAGEVSNGLTGKVSAGARAVAPALIVVAVVYAIAHVSGAHLNPAITLAFAFRGVFSWARVPLYWAAELAGAVLASLAIRGLFGTVEHVGATVPHVSEGRAVAVELVLTFLLVVVVLGTSTKHALIGPQAAIAVGATIAAAGLVALPLTGASMNPARSLGPALVSGYHHHVWIYAAGPFAGAAIAAQVTRAVHGAPKEEEIAAAEGE